MYINTTLKFSLITLSLFIFTACGGGTPTNQTNAYAIDDNKENTTDIPNTTDTTDTQITQEPTNTETNTQNNFHTADNHIIGARKVKSTPLSEGTTFTSPSGNGSSCTKASPCALDYALKHVEQGDVLFLRGGTYNVSNSILSLRKNSGTADNPIIVESYPGETAILDGKNKSKITKGMYAGDPVGFRINNGANYIKIRKIHFTHFGKQALVITSSHNIVEGCEFYNNKYVALQLTSTSFNSNTSKWSSGYNLIQDNIIHDNSDAGLTGGSYKNGGNADGISVSAGNKNKILYNLVYHNSDDGIDTWRSNDTEVAYNVVHSQGIADGNGGGIKLGGNLNRSVKNGMRAYAHHNLSYNNRAHGFNLNAGRDVKIEFNTSYNNKKYGYANLVDGDVILRNNISNHDKQAVHNEHGIQENNSWQLDEKVTFLSTDPHSNKFLKLSDDSTLNEIGAFTQSY